MCKSAYTTVKTYRPKPKKSIKVKHGPASAYKPSKVKMTSVLDALSSEEFDIEVGPLGPAPALRTRLRSMPQVQAVIKALNDGELTDEDLSSHIKVLCLDFPLGEPFAHNLAISAIAVVLEDLKTDFAEGFLRILSKLRLAELATASRVGAYCLKQRMVKENNQPGNDLKHGRF